MRGSSFLSPSSVSQYVPSTMSWRGVTTGWPSAGFRMLRVESMRCLASACADDDDRAARVVNALAEQVLAEPALLAAEHVGERLQLVIAGARDRAAAPAVVHERVDRLLEHALLVTDDDLRRTELEQTLEPVVPVDHAAVEVVQVARREPATVELHHRAQVRRNDRKDREDHPLGRRARAQQRLHQAEPLDGLLAALAGGRAHLGLKLERELLEIDLSHD